MGSTSGGWESFQEDGKHFRRMGSISGGWEAFPEDGKHFSKVNLEHQIVEEHVRVSYVKEGCFNYFHERY